MPQSSKSCREVAALVGLPLAVVLFCSYAVRLTHVGFELLTVVPLVATVLMFATFLGLLLEERSERKKKISQADGEHRDT